MSLGSLITKLTNLLEDQLQRGQANLPQICLAYQLRQVAGGLLAMTYFNQSPFNAQKREKHPPSSPN